MIALNIPDEWLPDIEEAVEAYLKNLGRYINKSNEDIYRIERYQLILDDIRAEKLAQ